MLVLLATAVLAAHSIALPGSTFEIDPDANLVADDAAPSHDWEDVPQGSGTGQERRGVDEPTGSGDDSFGQGTKEDTAVPTVVDGSIPNNKSDLKNFGAYLEENAAGKFLNIYWTRVQEPTGSTNMDFEFNKSEVISANGVTPVRTAGDILIQYDLASGGTNVELWLSTWITAAGGDCEANGANPPCWGARVDLDAADDGTGSINLTPIAEADADGLGGLSARTFGEAQIDFDVFATGEDECLGFGSAYLKSRSSDSFTAALKDFIAPIALDFEECGAIQITKTRKHAASDPSTVPHAGVVFTISGNGLPAGTTVTTNAAGVACLDGLVISTTAYTVTETVPSGYAADGLTAKPVTVNNAAQCGDNPYGGETVTFGNTPLTDVSVSVDSQVVGGTDSQIECTFDGETDTPPDDLDTPDATGDGTLTATGLLPGTYTCTIVVDP
jgi:hypothetical protein